MSGRGGDGPGDPDDHAPSPGTATTDWPTGAAEASCWPVVVAAGVAGVYAALALSLLDAGRWALGSGLGGLVLVVAGTAGWYWQGVGDGGGSRRAARSAHASPAPRTARAVAFLIVGVETATFGTLLAGYLYPLVSSDATWQAPATDPVRTAALTLLLVAGSVALRAARAAVDRGDRRSLRRSLRATIGLGVLFLGGLAGEYDTLAVGATGLREGPGTSAFLGLAGLHGLHVLAGIAAVAVVLARRTAGRPPSATRADLALVSIYWYFVVGTWGTFVAALAVGVHVSGG